MRLRKRSIKAFIKLAMFPYGILVLLFLKISWFIKSLNSKRMEREKIKVINKKG